MDSVRWRSAVVILFTTVFASYGNALDKSQKVQDPPLKQPSEPSVGSLEQYFTEGRFTTSIRTTSDLPSPFRRVLSASGCSLDDLAYEAGELILTGKGWRQKIYAVLPCGHGTAAVFRQTLYVLENKKEQAEVVLLPALSKAGGIEATRHPGYIVWHPEESTFTAEQGTDTIPHTRFRHHYKSNPGNTNGLVLVRVEKRVAGLLPIDSIGWEKVWEAPQWGTVDSRHHSE